MDPRFPIRAQCPPGTCICGRDALLAEPGGDVRILRLTSLEEKKLLARLESVSSLADLKSMKERMRTQLGIVLTIAPSLHGVRTVRGFQIQLEEQPGLCRKTRQAIPAAVRKCLERNPDIAYAILNERDLLGQA